MKKNQPDKKCFHSSVKDVTTGNNGEKLDGHITDQFSWIKLGCDVKNGWYEVKKSFGH